MSRLFKTLAAIALGALFVSSVSAQNFLYPETTEITAGHENPYYNGVLAQVLSAAYRPDVRIRMIAIQPFEPEYAYGIKADNDKFRFFSVVSTVRLWGYQAIKEQEKAFAGMDAETKKIFMEQTAGFRGKLPEDPKSVAVNTCENDIDALLATRVLNVWEKMLRQTRPTGSVLVTDGDTFRLSMTKGSEKLAALAYNPWDDTNSRRLIDVMTDMQDVCLKRTPNGPQKLEKQLAELEGILK